MADDVAEVAYAVAFDGVGPIFVTNEGLNNLWATTAGFASAYTGLVAPSSLPCGVDLRLGELTDSDAVIQIEDIDGTLPALFGSSFADADFLVETLEPGVTAGASLFSKYVGHEAIGAAGQRRRYSCVPNFNVGLRHLGENHAASLGHGPTPVTDTPVLWPGRRLAVYRVKKIGGVWQAWTASTRVWFGTLLGQGEQDGGTWSFKCAGPESWCGGNLGGAHWETPLDVEPAFELSGADEELVRVSLVLLELDEPNATPFHEWVVAYEDSATMPGVASYADAVTALNSILATVEADASSGDAYAEGTSTIRFSDSTGLDGIIVRWERDNEDASAFNPATDSEQLVVKLTITMHEKLWSALGYDVRQQNMDLDPVDQEDAFCTFHSTNVKGRWFANFYSANARAMAAFVSAEQDYSGLTVADYTNGQFERRWPPLFPGGGVSWTGEHGQEFTLSKALNSVHMTGSLSRPVMANPDDLASAITIGDSVGAANRQGLLVVDGPYRRRGDNDKVEPVEGYAFELERERREGRTTQVARVCWQEAADGSIVTGASGQPRLVIYAWENPKLYGFDYSRFEGTWGAWRQTPEGAKGLTVRPLTVFDYGNPGDRIDLVMQRVLATTGTGGSWYSDVGLTVPLFGGFPAEPYFDVGANDCSADVPIDAEVSELGLGIPASMIQDAGAWADALAEVGPNLQRCKAVFASGVSARHLLRSVLSPTGLCMSLAGGKFGIFDPWRLPAPDDADAQIDSEWYAGQVGNPSDSRPSQDFRVFAPIDRLDVKARIEPVEGKPLRTFERKATDFGSRYRSQTIRHSITGDHLVHPALGTLPGADWPGELNSRWFAGFNFWGLQHFAVPLELHAEDAIDLWPGNSILLTDEWLADPAGEYGISIAPGWVVSRTFDCMGERVLLKVIVNAETDFRMYSPAAVATHYDENDDGMGYRLGVEDDWLGFRLGASFDCQGFAEPTWSAEGGDALIEIFQYDGVTWTRGIFGVVDTVTAATGDCWINLTGALTGATYYRDMHHVVVFREFADQAAAWVTEFFAPVCLEDGTHSTGEVGTKFRS